MAKTQILPIRVSPGQKALIAENAEASGFDSTSEYLRQLGMAGGKPPRKRSVAGGTRGPVEQPDEFEAKVRELARKMPRRSAEIVARRERAKGR